MTRIILRGTRIARIIIGRTRITRIVLIRKISEIRVHQSFSSDTFNGTFVQIDSYLFPISIMYQLRQIDLTHHGRHHMRVLQMEVVIRTIEICGHHSDIVRTILEVITLTHLQTGNLRYGVLLVGVFQRACQQGILLHRLWGILGVDTGTAEEKELLHPMGIGLTDDIALDLHVHHNEIGTV